MHPHGAMGDVGGQSKVGQPEVLNLRIPQRVLDQHVEAAAREPRGDRVGEVPDLTP